MSVGCFTARTSKSRAEARRIAQLYDARKMRVTWGDITIQSVGQDEAISIQVDPASGDLRAFEVTYTPQDVADALRRIEVSLAESTRVSARLLFGDPSTYDVQSSWMTKIINDRYASLLHKQTLPRIVH